MKKTILLLTILISGCSVQKDLIGSYCNSFNDGFDSSCYRFKENQIFEYETVSDLGTYIKGSGNYNIENNRIKLLFTSDDTTVETQISRKDIPEESRDSIQLRFTIKDRTGNHQYGSMVLLESENYKNKDTYLPNQDLVLKLDRSNSVEKIKVFNIGYETFEFAQKLNKSQEIEIIQVPEQPYIVSDTVRYLDLKRNNSGIILKSGNTEFSKNKLSQG